MVPFAGLDDLESLPALDFTHDKCPHVTTPTPKRCGTSKAAKTLQGFSSTLALIGPYISARFAPNVWFTIRVHHLSRVRIQIIYLLVTNGSHHMKVVRDLVKCYSCTNPRYPVTSTRPDVDAPTIINPRTQVKTVAITSAILPVLGSGNTRSCFRKWSIVASLMAVYEYKFAVDL